MNFCYHPSATVLSSIFVHVHILMLDVLLVTSLLTKLKATLLVMWLPVGFVYLQDDLVGRLLLLRLIEDVNAPPRLIRGVRHIVPPPALVFI
jgi:hypothetical protein